MARGKKNERLESILDAARSILRESGDVTFTIKDVAKRAGVAAATVFNLLESKDGLFYSLLSRLLDDLFMEVRQYKIADPLQHSIEATEVVVNHFLADATVFRELFLVFLGSRDELHRPWFMHRSMEFWRHSVETAAKDGLIPAEEFNDDALPRALMLMFIGSVDLWVHNDLDDDGFRAQALYGTALVVLGSASKDTALLRERLRDIRAKLPQQHTFLRHLLPFGRKLDRRDVQP